MKQVKKVKPKYGTGKTLQEMFNLSKVSISFALQGRINTERAKRIRQAAINLGGDPIYPED